MSQSPTHIHRTRALKALQEVIERWQGLSLPWGPTGSVGFELASGRQVTTETSDLDLAIRAPHQLNAEKARSLWNCVTGLQANVDVRVETPICGFSLEEYVRACSARLLLRFPDGLRLGNDPWSVTTREQSNTEVT